MGSRTRIEWTRGEDGTPGATWNPLVGCTAVSAGCDNCYAETLVNRFAGTSPAFPTTFNVVTMRSETFLTQPLRWAKPRRVFVNSLSDLFHKDVSDVFIARVFAVMAQAQSHTFQLLTKRHGRMRSLLTSARFVVQVKDAYESIPRWDTVNPTTLNTGAWDGRSWPLGNVWVGVSTEDQSTANLRIPALLDTPATVRFISAEPLLGPINFGDCAGHDALNTTKPNALDWVIVGGESGPHSRPMNVEWARTIRDQCATNNVAFLFKQAGNVLAREWGTSGKGTDPQEWPEPFPRQYPTPRKP